MSTYLDVFRGSFHLISFEMLSLGTKMKRTRNRARKRCEKRRGRLNLNPFSSSKVIPFSFTVPISISSHKRRSSREKRKTHHQETASEVSSIDSDDNYRNFKKKNRDMQESLLLVNQQGVPFDFTARLNMLERAAYYNPLSSVNDILTSIP